jgi:prepilin-type N-terminal cleavage/methylation domain-containing protein
MLINKKAFTLIELLVIVLIIGILAAIALPQYQKAVWRSRSSQLQTYLKQLSDAQESYKLANSSYSNNFANLDIDFPLQQTAYLATWPDNGATDTIANDNIILTITRSPNRPGVFAPCWIFMALFRDGKYAHGGFAVFKFDNGNGGDYGSAAGLKDGILYCTDQYLDPYNTSFCRNVYGTNEVGGGANWRRFKSI